MRRILFVPLIAACASPTHTTNLDGVCFNSFEPLESNAVAGQAIEVPFMVRYGCNSGIAPATKSAKVVLTRPDGEVVEPDSAQYQGGVENPNAPQRTQHMIVGFTPDRPGTWNIAVTFDPGGFISRDIEAVVPRRDAPTKVLAWTGPSNCGQLAIDSYDTVLCLRSGNFRDREVFTSRGEVLYGRAFTVDRDVLWRLAEDGLERQLDDGSAFKVTHRLSRTGLAGPMVVENGDVWLRDGDELVRAHPGADGSLSLTTTDIHVTLDAIAATPDGVAFWRVDCLTLVPGGCQALDSFQPSSAEPAGGETDALYFHHQFECDDFGYPCDELVATDGTSKTRVPLPSYEGSSAVGHDVALGPFPPVVPMSRAFDDKRVAVPRRDGGKLSLELFYAGTEFKPVSSATRTHAFAFAADGRSVKVFVR